MTCEECFALIPACAGGRIAGEHFLFMWNCLP
jgi:hypothetical protein